MNMWHDGRHAPRVRIYHRGGGEGADGPYSVTGLRTRGALQGVKILTTIEEEATLVYRQGSNERIEMRGSTNNSAKPSSLDCLVLVFAWFEPSVHSRGKKMKAEMMRRHTDTTIDYKGRNDCSEGSPQGSPASDSTTVHFGCTETLQQQRFYVHRSLHRVSRGGYHLGTYRRGCEHVCNVRGRRGEIDQ